MLRSQASEPAAESITPIACQAFGTAWQNAWTRACAVGGELVERGEHDAARAERDRERPGAVDTDAERAGCLVAGAGGDGDAVLRLARTLRALQGPRQPGGVDVERGQDVFAPGAVRDVEQDGARGVGDIGGVLAGQPEADVVLGQSDSLDARVDVRFVVAEPEELRRGEAGERAVAGEGDEPFEPDRLLDLVALGLRALVVPEDRGPECLLSASSATRPCIWPLSPMPAGVPAASARCASTVWVARHQSSGSCSAQPGRGVDSGYSASWRARTVPSGSIARPLVAVVPTSMPTRIVSGSLRGGRGSRAAGSCCARCPRPPTRPRGALGKKVGIVASFFPRSGRRGDCAVAAKQHGNITRRQLLDLGVDDDANRYRVKVGPAAPGVPWRVLGRAGVRSPRRNGQAPPCWRAALALRSATARRWCCGGTGGGGIEAVRGHGRRRPAHQGIRVHRSTTLRRRDVTTQLGIRVTTPARTLFDISPRLNDGRSSARSTTRCTRRG